MTDLERAMRHIKTRADAWAVKEIEKALSQEPCERFEWGIDGNVYKITKAKDGKEICQQVCDDAISREDATQTVNDTLAEYIPYFRNDQIGIPLECARALNDLPSVTQKSGEWIPVSKRLPERNKRVIVCYETMEGLKVDTSIFDKYGCFIGKAVAWMPLPEPYKDMRGDTE